MSQLLPLHNNNEDEVIAWAKNVAKEMTEKEKRDTDIVLLSLSQSKLLEMNKQSLYNGGYLFLQDIFYDLKLDKMCEDIKNDYNFQYDLSNILSRLIYSRILYPSSKYSTFDEFKEIYRTAFF